MRMDSADRYIGFLNHAIRSITLASSPTDSTKYEFPQKIPDKHSKEESNIHRHHCNHSRQGGSDEFFFLFLQTCRKRGSELTIDMQPPG